MRITEIYISEYKNLKDFTVKFDGKSFVDLFVGKNGTGKSNFFEACLQILRHIDDREFFIRFNYRLCYTIDENEVRIEWKDDKWIDTEGKETKLPKSELLPDNILVYYSGHNTTVKEYLTEYEERHKATVGSRRNSATFSTDVTRRFIGIGANYKSILLSVMLLQSQDGHAKRIILEKLGIQAIGDEIQMIFKRPDYAIGSKEMTFDEFDDTRRFWSAQGYFKALLDEVWNTEKLNKQIARSEGKIGEGDEEEYILYRSFGSFKRTFANRSALELFIAIDNLRSIGILKDISVEVELTNGKKLGLNQFSDGQFQSIYIYTITELFKEKNCITLLDEPDSFLHPEWQYDFFKQIGEISKESKESNHVLMVSHSAVTLLNSPEKKINLLQFKDNNIVNHKVAKSYAVSQLSSTLIKLHNDKHILSIIHTVGQNKPILFTEGYSDPVTLKEAWTQLYAEEPPFEICFGHGCLYLRLLLQSDKLLGEMGDFPVFGLFDFDMAFNEWNSLPKEGNTLLEADPYKGMIKKVEGRNSYAILMPVPRIAEIERQVINGDTTYKENSKVEMEHLFYSEETADRFHKVTTSGGGEIIDIGDGVKMKFATEVVPAMDKQYFEVLRPMFEFIISKCQPKN